MTTEDSYFVGYRIFHDKNNNMTFTKRRYAIPYKFIIDMEDTTGLFSSVTKEQTVQITTVGNTIIHIIANIDELIENHQHAMKMSNL